MIPARTKYHTEGKGLGIGGIFKAGSWKLKEAGLVIAGSEKLRSLRRRVRVGLLSWFIRGLQETLA